MKSFDVILSEIRNANTRNIYASIYRNYAGFLNGNNPTVDNAEAFIRSKSEFEATTLNLYTCACRTYFRLNGVDILKGRLKMLRTNNVREDKYVTRKEVDQLYKCAENLRDKTIIRMLYHVGLRVQELINLDVRDLDLKNEKVNVQGVKGSHRVRRVRFIRPELCLPTIRAYLEQRGIDPDKPTKEQLKEPVIISKRGNNRLKYTGVFRAITPLGNVIGKPDLSPHWLRHGFVVWNKTHGVPPELTAKQIGDTIETTTKIYSHYSESDVDRVYDEIQGRISEDKPNSVNPIDEIEELKVEIKGQDTKIEKLHRGLQILDELLSVQGVKRGIWDLPPVKASDIEPGEERRLVQEYKELLGTWGE